MTRKTLAKPQERSTLVKSIEGNHVRVELHNIDEELRVLVGGPMIEVNFSVASFRETIVLGSVLIEECKHIWRKA